MTPSMARWIDRGDSFWCQSVRRQDLPRNDEPITAGAGDPTLCQCGAFAVYYAPDSWDSIRLERLDDLTPEGLREILGGGTRKGAAQTRRSLRLYRGLPQHRPPQAEICSKLSSTVTEKSGDEQVV